MLNLGNGHERDHKAMAFQNVGEPLSKRNALENVRDNVSINQDQSGRPFQRGQSPLPPQLVKQLDKLLPPAWVVLRMRQKLRACNPPLPFAGNPLALPVGPAPFRLT